MERLFCIYPDCGVENGRFFLPEQGGGNGRFAFLSLVSLFGFGQAGQLACSILSLSAVRLVERPCRKGGAYLLELTVRSSIQFSDEKE